MKLALTIRSAAEAELKEQIDYIAERSPGAAGRLRAAFGQTLETIVAFPASGSPRFPNNPGLREIRVSRIKGFPEHQVFYRRTETTIEILHVWHAKRDLRRLRN